MNAMKLVVPLLIALAYGPSPGLASPILDTTLASFAVLGATPDVTNTGATTIIGGATPANLGVSPAASITGQAGITINGDPALTTGAVFVHLGDATATSAQTQLGIAITDLGLIGPGTLLPADLTGLTIFPGVFTVPAGTTNLSGAVTLDGLGDANAFWLFQMPSTLITSSASVVNVIDTGAGAGVFWVVGSSATLGTTTSFEGNILAHTSIALDTGATIGCGRALANTGEVTMDTNTISLGCFGTGEEGSNGLSGNGLEFLAGPGPGPGPGPGSVHVIVPGQPPGTGPIASVPGQFIPEPGTLLLFSLGLAGLFAFRKKAIAVA